MTIDSKFRSVESAFGLTEYAESFSSFFGLGYFALYFGDNFFFGILTNCTWFAWKANEPKLLMSLFNMRSRSFDWL